MPMAKAAVAVSASVMAAPATAIVQLIYLSIQNRQEANPPARRIIVSIRYSSATITKTYRLLKAVAEAMPRLSRLQAVAVAEAAAAVANNQKRKENIMDILKSLGLKDKPEQDQNKPDPHTHGGCCGSCGGQNKNQEKNKASHANT